VVLFATWLLRPWLFAVANDEEYARASGLPVTGLNIALAVLTALTLTSEKVSFTKVIESTPGLRELDAFGRRQPR